LPITLQFVAEAGNEMTVCVHVCVCSLQSVQGAWTKDKSDIRPADKASVTKGQYHAVASTEECPPEVVPLGIG